jgi:hypothetical protein
MDLVFRATIKPAYQRRISIHLDRTLVYVVVSLRKGVVLSGAKISSNQYFASTCLDRRLGTTVAIAVSFAVFYFFGSVLSF